MKPDGRDTTIMIFFFVSSHSFIRPMICIRNLWYIFYVKIRYPITWPQRHISLRTSHGEAKDGRFFFGSEQYTNSFAIYWEVLDLLLKFPNGWNLLVVRKMTLVLCIQEDPVRGVSILNVCPTLLRHPSISHQRATYYVLPSFEKKKIIFFLRPLDEMNIQS